MNCEKRPREKLLKATFSVDNTAEKLPRSAQL